MSKFNRLYQLNPFVEHKIGLLVVNFRLFLSNNYIYEYDLPINSDY